MARCCIPSQRRLPLLADRRMYRRSGSSFFSSAVGLAARSGDKTIGCSEMLGAILLERLWRTRSCPQISKLLDLDLQWTKYCPPDEHTDNSAGKAAQNGQEDCTVRREQAYGVKSVRKVKPFRNCEHDREKDNATTERRSGPPQDSNHCLSLPGYSLNVDVETTQCSARGRNGQTFGSGADAHGYGT